MEFSKKTLPKEALPELYTVALRDIQPFSPMFGPTYVFLKAHAKLIAVKKPLDFFVPDELKRLGVYEKVYFQKSVQNAIDFRDAGKQVRNILLKINPMKKTQTTQLLHPSPVEAARWILYILGPLWWTDPAEGGQIESFFVTIFIHGVCGLLPQETLLKTRDNTIEEMDRALYCSSWAAFLALHLGYCHLEFITNLRNNFFNSIIFNDPYTTSPPELNDLIQKITSIFNEKTVENLTYSRFFSEESIFQKLRSKFFKIQTSLISTGSKRPSVYGTMGFIDAEP